MILRSKRNGQAGAVLLTAATVAELGLTHLGQTLRIHARGTPHVDSRGRHSARPRGGDRHAITINAPPDAVLRHGLQMGWHQAGRYGPLG